MRTGVVGHVEWVRLATVDRVPERGTIIQAYDSWVEPAGGGAVAAGQMLKLAGNCDFFAAIGKDEAGARVRRGLEALGLTLHAAVHDEPQRRAFVFIDAGGERTITSIGKKLHPFGGDPLPWDALAEIDAVYFTAGDVEALRAARQARVLVATARELATLVEARVQLDALVHSATDPGEAYEASQIDPEPKLVVATRGSEGGRYIAGEKSGTYAATELPGPFVDSYGAGDSFAAGLAFALARGDELEEALAFAAKCGAAAMTGRGAYEGQLRLEQDR